MPLNSGADLDYDYLFKILIIGDAGVGKTAILKRFAEDAFTTSYVATIGVDFQIRTINVDEKHCKLQVWDTAGQDRFKCVVSSFYRGAHGVMICFDITDGTSFINVDNWYSEIERYCPSGTPVFLVGTKSDLQSQRSVSSSQIQAYVEKRECTYVETSSKTSANIENCFVDFSKTLMVHTNQIQTDDRNKSSVILANQTNAITSKDDGCLGMKKCTI